MLFRKLKIPHAFALLLLLFAASCSKESTETIQKATSDSQLIFTIAEQTGTVSDNMAKLKASNVTNGRSVREATKQHHFIENGAFRVTTSVSREPILSVPNKPLTKNKVGNRMSGLETSPSTTSLAKNMKYRVVLYDRSTSPSTFVSSTLGTAGQKLLIDVDKGKDYDWAVFSFNDENDPGESTEVITSGLRDLLHAKGTTGTIPGKWGDGAAVNVPINVVLQHKLANISVQITAKDYPAKITNIGAALGRGSYFCKNNLNIKTGEFVYQNTQIELDPTMVFKAVDGDTVMVADYYTSKFAPISNFFITINNLSIRTASNETKTLGAAATYGWDDVSPVAGERIITSVSIEPVRDVSGDKFKILSIGSTHYSLSSSAYSGARLAMRSVKNFGPTGTYPTNLDWQITHKSSPTNAYNDLSNYKMVFVGYLGAPKTDADARRLIDYIEKGGTVIWTTQTPTETNDRTVWQRFAGNTATASRYTGYGAAFGNSDVLRGPFGDARGTTYGNYSIGNGYGISNFTQPVIELAISPSGNAAVWKARDHDFYFFGSAGMQKYHATAHAGVNPFLLTGNPDYQPRIAAWHNQQNVSNSVVLMNIVAKTIDKVMTSKK